MSKPHRPKIINRMPAFINDLDQRAAAALHAAGLIGASHAARFTPIDTSNLLNSQYLMTRMVGTRVVATIGYTAEYALAVHEASGKLKGLPRPKRNGKDVGVFWGPGTERRPEFLTEGFKEAKPLIDAEMRRRLKV